MIINIKMRELLDDMMIENIANMSDEELKDELQLSDDELKAQSKPYRDQLEQVTREFKKARLKQARVGLDQARTQNTGVSVADYLAKSGKDAKAVLIDMFMQRKLPEGLTVAFRDGKEITSEEAEHILANLISIGAVNNDDQTG